MGEYQHREQPAPLQASPNEPSPYAAPMDAPAYVIEHFATISHMVQHHMRGMALPSHPRMTFLRDGLAAGFEDAVRGLNQPPATTLTYLLYPTDPWRLVDLNRALTRGTAGQRLDGHLPRGLPMWNPAVGTALALEIAERL